MYVARFILTLVFCVASLSHSALADGRLVAIIAVDTLSGEIKRDMQTNAKMLETALRRNVPPHRLDIHILKDNGWSRDGASQTIRDLNVSEDDALFFFYSGHGYYQNGSFFTPPADQGNRLYFSDVRNALLGKGARLTVSVLDCCQTHPGDVNVAPAPGPADVSTTDEVSTLFQDLFFASHGEFILNSSSPREYALSKYLWLTNGQVAVTNGSLFTTLLARSWGATIFDETLTALPTQVDSWQELYRFLRHHTHQRFELAREYRLLTLGNGRQINQRTQTVRAHHDGRLLE